MPEVRTLLEHHLEFSPGFDLEAFFSAIPARWAVALLRDENQHPLQLISVRDLRDALRNRLADEPSGKRVNWREVVRSITWQPVDSEFEADWIYLQVAAQFFPGIYDLILRKNQAWFIHVDPDAQFPRYAKTTEHHTASGQLIGPILDKHAAARLIELIEDAFDLCRYYNILTQAPHGKACPYKEMGKCPAPCDGSISIGQYRRLIDFSLQAIAEPSIFIADQIRRMESAAAELRFETAAKIHSYVDHLRDLGRGAFRFARPISDFQFVTLQTGPGKQSVKIFLITLGRIEPILSLRGEPASWQELHHTILTRAEESHHAPAADQGVPRIPGEPRSGVKHGFSPSAGTPGEGQGGGLGPHGEQGRLVERIPPPLSSPGVPGEDVRAPGILGTPADHAAGRIGVVVHHLFSSRKKAGAWIPLAEVNESALSAAYRLLSRNRAQAADKSQRVSPMPGVEADHE